MRSALIRLIAAQARRTSSLFRRSCLELNLPAPRVASSENIEPFRERDCGPGRAPSRRSPTSSRNPRSISTKPCASTRRDFACTPSARSDSTPQI